MFPNDAQFQLATHKGVFPYDFVTSSERLQTASLPTKDAFHNVLSGTDVSDLDYTHAQKAWDVFHCATLKEYALSYLRVDTCLLADIFESFRFVCLQHYSLDPAHYITAPSLAWDALLIKTGVRLDLVTDPDIYLFLESAVRGGITNVSRCHAKANNVYMSSHDPSLPSSYICYFDVNALYAHTMLDKLPVGNFQWVPKDEYTSWDFNTIDIDGDTSFFAEVDLTFPDDCHDRLSDLPLAPVNGVPPNVRMSKLLLTLAPRTKYIVHATSLRHYVRYGAVIGQVHRVLRFAQAAWMRDYIAFNAERRAQAANPFEKSFFKLLSNSVYGKSLENTRKHKDIRIASRYDSIYGAAELIGRPTFKARRIIDESLVLIEMLKGTITFDRPLYTGVAILYLSKLVLYDFHYNYMQKKFPPQSLHLLYTDTDSLIYHVVCDNIYDSIRPDLASRFDTSNYAPGNEQRFPLVNKGVTGVMKDEAAGNVITEFVGLRPKLYAFKMEDSSSTRKAKEIKASALRSLLFPQYLECLLQNSRVLATQHHFRSRGHTVFTERVTKVALSSGDDKRWLSEDGVSTLPWGHKDLRLSPDHD
ncbi:uncharacterized protein LOC134531497 [Bacillus rossius redtenbacheri]|uniref:uncharacterized protein LOC134531497 n=1 Tax=Bacillus rossius redtenbacheri TaxID=93214 RepID=UPI002FDD7251